MISGPFYKMIEDGYQKHNNALLIKGGLNSFFVVFLIAAVAVILIDALTRWLSPRRPGTDR